MIGRRSVGAQSQEESSDGENRRDSVPPKDMTDSRSAPFLCFLCCASPLLFCLSSLLGKLFLSSSSAPLSQCDAGHEVQCHHHFWQEGPLQGHQPSHHRCVCVFLCVIVVSFLVAVPQLVSAMGRFEIFLHDLPFACLLQSAWAVDGCP